MKNNRANRHNDRGFTLSEVLLTVAILVVLFALAAVPVSKMRRELRQTELDSKAEILFQTAQNRMTQLLAAGMEEKYKSGGDVKRFIRLCSPDSRRARGHYALAVLAGI